MNPNEAVMKSKVTLNMEQKERVEENDGFGRWDYT